MTANGNVRWLRYVFDLSDENQPGMGIVFDTLSQEDKKVIRALMSNRAPMFYSED